MKLKIKLSELIEALNWVSKSLPLRPTIPILGGILIQTQENSVEFAAFDYEVATKVNSKAEIIDKGSVLVLGKVLVDIVKSLTESTVSMELVENELQITCGKAIFLLPTLPIEDYPSLPKFPNSIGTMLSKKFMESVVAVSTSASRDDSFPMLTGIKVEINDNMLTLSATDKFRLSYLETEWESETEKVDLQFLVPAKNLVDFAKSIPGETEERITIALTDKEMNKDTTLGIRLKNKELITRLLDLDYPPTKKLLRKEHTTVAQVNTAQLMAAIKRVALLSERGTQILLSFMDNKLMLSAGSGNGQAKEEINIDIKGPNINIGFNPTYLLEGLASLKSELVFFGFSNPKLAVVVKPRTLDISELKVSETEQYLLPETNLIYLLMPIRIV